VLLSGGDRLGDAADRVVVAQREQRDAGLAGRRDELEQDARAGDSARVAEAIELVADTRLRLSVNVAEELALEALAYRLEALLAD